MNHEWLALLEEDGRAYLLQRVKEVESEGLVDSMSTRCWEKWPLGTTKIGQKILRS